MTSSCSRAQCSEIATCSRRSIASCMPSSMPELMCASRPSFVGCSTRTVECCAPVHLGERQDVDSGMLLGIGDALVDLGRHETLVRHDLAELAVEADLQAAVRHHRVPPPPRRAGRSRRPSSRRDSHATSACTNSGVVHAFHTRCFGASNSRVMRICSSVGSVTVAGRYSSLPSPSSFCSSSSNTTSSWSNRSDQVRS